MSTAVETSAREWTEASIEAIPDDGFNHEIVNGELVMSPKNNFEHENLCARLFVALSDFNRHHKLGVVLGSSAGFWMQNRNCRAPDVSFISRERIQQAGFRPDTRRFFPGAPDLAVEVVSASNSAAELTARLRDFFSSGTRLAWLIQPEDRSVEICHAPDRRNRISGGSLDGEDILPGFQLRLETLFEPWDWE